MCRLSALVPAKPIGFVPLIREVLLEMPGVRIIPTLTREVRGSVRSRTKSSEFSFTIILEESGGKEAVCKLGMRILNNGDPIKYNDNIMA
jgi:hypothetical protein